MVALVVGDNEKGEIFLALAESERVHSTTFRGTSVKKAGNIFKWPTFGRMVKDREFIRKLRKEINKLLEKQIVLGTIRIELEFYHPIAYDSVLHRDDLEPEDLSFCETRLLSPSRDARADFLPLDYILAPQTNIMTLVIDAKKARTWTFIVETVYAEPDCGRLEGNMTEKFGLVWLDWENAGDPHYDPSLLGLPQRKERNRRTSKNRKIIQLVTEIPASKFCNHPNNRVLQPTV